MNIDNHTLESLTERIENIEEDIRNIYDVSQDNDENIYDAHRHINDNHLKYTKEFIELYDRVIDLEKKLKKYE